MRIEVQNMLRGKINAKTMLRMISLGVKFLVGYFNIKMALMRV